MGVKQPRQQGVTLIELIIAIVVLGIAAVGILNALGRTTALNVDPLLRAQSLALAQSFMDEVTSKPFYPPDTDPAFIDDPDSIDPCHNDEMPDLGVLNGEARNSLLQSICMFDGYDSQTHESGIKGPEDSAITGLDSYSVEVSISPGGDSAPFDNSSVPANCLLRIEVSATDPSGSTLSLVSYRSSYWEECE